MTASVTALQASKVVGWGVGAGLVVILASTAACGGSSGGTSDTAAGGSTGSGAASSVSSAASEPAIPSESASAAAPAGGGGSLGTEICDVIKKVQADVIKGSPGGAYQAQLAIGLAGMLGDQSKVEDFQNNGDAQAKKTCPTEYAAFLKESGITTLASL